MLTASHLTCNYGTGQAGIDDISLEIKPGELVAVLGMNGSGKTTLGRALGGLLLVRPGMILLDGQAVTAEELRQRAVYLFSPVGRQFIGSTVEEDILFGLEYRRMTRQEMAERLETALDRFALRPLRHRNWQQLSEGELQRAALAAVLVLEPDYLVLDEPTATLDLMNTQLFYRLITELKHQGKGILVLTNQVEEAARADRIVMLAAGRIMAEGTPWQVLAQAPPDAYADGITLAVQVARILAGYGFDLKHGPLDMEGLVDRIWRSRPKS